MNGPELEYHMQHKDKNGAVWENWYTGQIY